ncbi:DNA mismatch repair protein MutS [Tissierella sp. Yu-01]|uniref:DNA mismatch repair protein MutS n=1 Tax=Tissierella sp. Yu-01 TaxID=3035694 RepID=UPI00240DA215|nr:DNA mismatch repair protein MutS [Tissierella sp. Yu-01]WFA09729.1 DNA mismatch repair protein MutS [Tissierella sp. Yu-01]
MENLTPMMKQYMEIKEKYKDSILFFRLGDFYEMFFEDAKIASKELEITLTQRDCGQEEKAPMCGIPHHVSDTYISKLVEKGYKVAICDQLENPALAKGIVKRDVVRIITPGTITDANMLDDKSNNFLVSIYFDDFGIGITYVDNSTGEMYTTEFQNDEDSCYRFIIDELGKTTPSEIICNNKFTLNKRYMKIIKNKINPYINTYENIKEVDEKLKSYIYNLYKIDDLKKIGINEKIYAIISTSKLIEYLYDTQKNSLDHINTINYYEPANYMVMDINTRTNLEINETIRSKEKKGALIGILDKTQTAMGGRLLKKWLEQPLLDMRQIKGRLEVVEFFTNNLMIMDDLRALLRDIYDIERLSSKITNSNCNGRDFLSLKNSIKVLPEIKEILNKCDNEQLNKLGKKIDDLHDIYTLIESAIDDEAPITLKEGGLIKTGYNKELDELRDSSFKGKEWLSNLELQERNKTGIKNLKIGYNRIYGYYLEVTKSNLNLVPKYFIRKQTLANSERYYTEELKNMEAKILGSEEKSLDMEYEIFLTIRNSIKMEIKRLQEVSKYIATLDVLCSFGFVANNNNYVKPELNIKGVIEIDEGRHPVVEATIDNNLFIPNDTYLDTGQNMVQIITGPNMAGKSTYMRQVAIITLLAQIGSFVPAKKANIGIVDRIFTRIGASDNLSQGESTFMVEMNEVSNIIKSATSKSLIILDEVGRGTSTYDGLSIAWAVVEFILENISAKTLFATHYHELTQLEEKFKGIVNLTILAEEKGDDIVFLRKIVKGSTNRSYGIQVAKLAGINKEIIDRANEILTQIEGSHEINLNNNSKDISKQLNLLDYKKDYFLDRIKNIDIHNLTPIEALNTLNNLVEDAKGLKERS